MTIQTIRRTALVAAAGLVAALSSAAAAAQPAAAASAASAPTRTYAIVSLIGDEFTVVSRRPEVGTNLTPNERTPQPVPDAIFDRIAAAEVEALLLRAKPGTPVLRALIRDPRLFALQDKLLTESSESHDMRIALRDLLAKAGATDLFLVTKHRGAPSFEMVTGKKIGAGSIGGIGFYIDNETHIYNTVTKVEDEGFLAPYAYVAVSLLDIGSMRVVKTGNGRETMVSIAAEKGGASHAWDALTPREKVDALDHVIRKAVDAGAAGMIPE
jgi:hypothetical protein